MQWRHPISGSILVGVWLAAAGCSSDKEYHPVEQQQVVDEHGHHHHEAPHGGHLVELGKEEYHAEIVFDADSKTITVYLLGSDTEKPQTIPIEGADLTLNLVIDGTPHQLTPAAQPQEDDPEGESSRFVLADNPTVTEQIASEEDLEGTVRVTIGGKPYSGPIGHDHHDH